MPKLSAQVGSLEREVVVEPLDAEAGRWRVVIGGVERVVDARRIDGTLWSFLLDGQQTLIDVEPNKDGDPVVDIRGTQVTVKLLDARRKLLADAAAKKSGGAAGAEVVRAPMPGKVVKVLCKAGDKVTAGQGILVVEAMKMENEIRAPRDAVIKELKVKEGQPVEAQEVLVTLE